MFDSKAIEKEIQAYWAKNKIAEQITKFDKNSKKKKFYLLDGPPYANGLPHAGHVMTIVFKDMWGKFKNMQGHQVWWQPGFDCHGLPIENKVEQKIGITSKKDIEKFGVDKFIEECRKFSISNLNEWMSFYKQIGAWKGWLKPYLTFENYFIESGWWTAKTLYEKGLMVRGEKPIHWCSHCQTPLAGYEATDSYADVTDPGIYVKFKITGKNSECLVAFTTTPWTLPGNVALAVHPDEDYVKIKVESTGEILIIAKSREKEVLKKAKINPADAKIIETVKGKKLEGLRYEPLLNVLIQNNIHKQENAHKVVLSIPILKKVIASKVAEKKGITTDLSSDEKFGHLVTMDTGTGIVHIAPGHGQEDNRVGEHYKLPIISPVDDEGKLTTGTEPFSGIFAKDADKLIVDWLSENNKLLHFEKIVHSYPLCWRCKSPLLFRVTKQWFFPIDSFKQNMLKQNQQTRWLPDFAKTRMHNWLEQSPDWCISIQRYWGIPLPVWECNSCRKISVIGSKKELESRMIKEQKGKIKLDDLHKHVVDQVILNCDQCSKQMQKHKDLMNIWVESGITPWASLGYPHHDKGLFDKLWQVDLIDESQDQIRGWFYALAFMGMATFDKIPYKTVCMNGWTLDEKGEKMSKSLGNVISSEQCLETLGADVLRLYNCYNIAPWETHKFSLNEGKELFRLMNVLVNLENFVNMYGMDFSSKEKFNNKNLRIEDKWIISKLNTLIKETTSHFENFEFHFLGRKLTDFMLNDFSRTYMKIAKERLSEDDAVKEVHFVVKKVLLSYLKLLAPICPFITEKLFLSLGFEKIEKQKSIHLCSYPIADAKLIDNKLEEEMEIAFKIIESVHSVRQENSLRLRWPIRKIVLAGNNRVNVTASDLRAFLQSMCNSKQVEFDPNVKMDIEVKPNYASIGPSFGKDTSKVVSLIMKQKPEELKIKLDKIGSIILDNFTITKEHVKIVSSLPASVKGASFDEGAVIVDIERDSELKEEAFVRELIREIQSARKEKGLKLSQKIKLVVEGPEFLEKWKMEIENVTSSNVRFGKTAKNSKEIDIEGQKARIYL